MIDPITAFAAIKSAHGALMSAVKVGKDLSQLGTAIGKYAKGEASLQAKAEAKKSGFFKKLRFEPEMFLRKVAILGPFH